MDVPHFHYVPRCSVPGCSEPAPYKLAAPWSDGTSRELKNYGLACRKHREEQFVRAQRYRSLLVITEGETVGPVAVYELVAGTRDVDLPELAIDPEASA